MRHLFMLLALVGVVGCSHIGALRGPDDAPVVLSTPEQGTDLQRSRVPEPDAPYVPVVRPPEVLRVWVLARANAHGDVLQGYWWHLLSRDWAFEQVPTAQVRSPTETTELPYSPLESSGAGRAELSLSSSNAEVVERANEAGAAALPDVMKNQILKAIQLQSGGK